MPAAVALAGVQATSFQRNFPAAIGALPCGLVGTDPRLQAEQLTNSPAPQSEPRRIGFLGFDDVTTLDLTGPLEAFATARREGSDRPCYETVLIGASGKTFSGHSGATFKAQFTTRTAPPLDTIIIPGGPGLRNADTSKVVVDWLLGPARQTRRIAAVSTGIYPLAQSGLLDGRRVTTHWRHTSTIASMFRRLEVDDSGSFIQDGQFYTCGGGTAGIEMSLALIQEDYGPRTALAVARELVVALRPPGQAERYIAPAPYQPTAEERLAELPAWISSRLQANLSVEVLADRACLCPRHFSRLFKQAFESTPADFVEVLRIKEAARRLSIQRLSIAAVAEAVGFKSPEVFRRAFERRFGVSPRAFQQRLREGAAPRQGTPGQSRKQFAATK